jgi:hypothetical protein
MSFAAGAVRCDARGRQSRGRVLRWVCRRKEGGAPLHFAGGQEEPLAASRPTGRREKRMGQPTGCAHRGPGRFAIAKFEAPARTEAGRAFIKQ